MTAFGDALIPVFSVLFDTALKGVVLIAAAGVAAYLLRKKSAAARHAAWTAAVIGHLGLPALATVMPDWRIPLLRAPQWVETTSTDTPVAPVPAPTTEASSSFEAAARATTAPAPSPGPEPATGPQSGGSRSYVLALLWILGTTVVLLRLAVGTWRVSRLAKLGDRVDDGEWLSLTQRLAKRLGITRPLILLRGESLAVPITWGVVYPAVLLPPESNEWPEERRRFVLVHEMAHVKRFDALTQLLAQVTIAILWFDPFLWYAAHRMRVEREHACDDYVLRDGTAPSLYAGELLEMVQSIGSPSRESAAPAFAALAMARRSEFEGRMLAILDSRQNRQTLDRRSALIASVALALLVLPLAALKPFASATPASAIIVSSLTPAPEQPMSTSYVPLSDSACDSVMAIPVDPSRSETRWTHLHVLENEKTDQLSIVEFLSYKPGRCAQAIIDGPATFVDDRLAALPPGSEAYFREISGNENRVLRISPAANGKLAYAASVNGRPSPFDAAGQRWVARVLPEALKETAVDAPERVSRWLSNAGFAGVLLEIGRINNPGAKRAHYLALLDQKRLNEREAADVRSHAARQIKGSSSDLKAVLDRLPPLRNEATRANAPAPTEDIDTLTRYAQNDDPAMILMALQGAKAITNDEDRRVLLQTIAPKALGSRNAALRKAFFDAAGEMTSDADLRVTLTTALTYAKSDPEVALQAFKLVASQMSSDEDKRVTLTVAVSQKVLTTPAVREGFMAAARTIESSSDFTALMQAALRQ